MQTWNVSRAARGLFLWAAALGLFSTGRAEDQAFRPPAVPLVACDPYFSIWSDADRLTDDVTRHWTGKPQSLGSLIRVDGRVYRLMGAEPKSAAAAMQRSVTVWPTRTVYEFDAGGARVLMTFMSAALPYDLDLLSRPVTYLTWEVVSDDGRRHDVDLYYDNTAETVVNDLSQEVVWARGKSARLENLSFGTKEQRVLGKKGDDLRIDWGYQYVSIPLKQGWRAVFASREAAWAAFAQGGGLPQGDQEVTALSVKTGAPVAALAIHLGPVETSKIRRHLVLAYDDLESIEYFQQHLKGYWRRKGMEIGGLLNQAESDYEGLRAKCARFDEELMTDLRRIGGEKYARLAALAYRQCLAANKLVADGKGQPLLFPKENFSNGCIATMDVIYPMDPFFLLFSPSLTKATLTPILAYAASDRWRFPFAPHDLGTYPKANGQVYGGGEKTEKDQMPVEETGNVLLLLAALAKIEGNSHFADAYWPTLERWADYLQQKGFDPENQLCTDDFAGHLAHNVNLSAKAILALGAFGELCEAHGDHARAVASREMAIELSSSWTLKAKDGDHYRLAFDRPGTWSQKYNLVWDRILGMNFFPQDVATEEMAFYRKKQNEFGLPLDNRKDYTKLDWTVWTATLTGSQADFEALVDPLYHFLDKSPSRVPMTDWFGTKDGKQVGFQARSVVGGVYIPLLYDGDLWRKWARRDRTKAGEWAPIPPAGK